MEVDIDIYFWMVDRGVYDDDQRNKVDMERNKVRLHREHSQRLENGYYLAKLMMILKKSVVKISRKPFSLDPNLANMKDNITSVSKQTNWTIICKELKKFGIRVDSEKRQKILEGRFQIICEILSRLFEFDNGGGQNRIATDAASEMNFQGERDHSSGDLQKNPNDSTNVSIDGLTNKRRQLDPLSPAKVKNQQSKLPGSLTSPKKPRGVNQSVTSLNDISDGKELGETETTLEFILLSLSKHLGIKPKQAAGLLSNNHKYLVHIAVKGMKGGDYSKMLSWYQSIYGHAKHIVGLIDNEKEHNSMKLTLNILKCGLYSHNPDLLVTCARLLSKLGQEINLQGGQLAGLAWDWFTDNTGNTSSSPENSQRVDDSIARDLSPGLGVNLPSGVLNESGLASCLAAMRRNKSEGIESVAPLMVHFGRNNYMEFFTYHLRRHFSSDPQQKVTYITCLHDIIMALGTTSMFYDSMVTTGVIDDLISQAIRMADYDPNGGNSPKERSSAIAFLADVWELKSDRIDENHEVAQAILTVLKRGCRDRTRILRTVSFEQMFKLLAHFSLNRNQFAPIIYKSLTFLLIEFHQHVEIREQLMRQFGTLFQQIQTIPVAILCEPLLKQIVIAQSTSLSPPTTQQMEFNIFDFEFFGVVANHKRATVSIGLQIVDTMVHQATTQVFYANSATSIVLELVHRFSREQPMHQHLGKITEDLVQALDESERWKKLNQQSFSPPQDNGQSLRKAKSKGPLQLDPQQSEQQTLALARRMRERLIVNFLKQLIMFGVEMVKENIRSQVLRTYARLEQQGKVKQPKSLHYLLQLYRSNKEDVPQMLSVFVEQEKTRSRKRMQLLEEAAPTQIDDYLLNDTSLVQGEDSFLMANKPLTRAQLHLEKVMKDIEKIKAVKNEAKDKKILEEELRRVKDEQQKVQAKKKVERIQLEHGVLPAKKLGAVTRGLSVGDNSRTLQQRQSDAPMDKDGRPIEIKIIKARDLDELSEIDTAERRLSLLPAEDHRKPGNKTVLKQLKEFQLFDLRFEEQKDQDAVRFFVKKHLKVLKNLFAKYANTTGPINTVQHTFEDLHKLNANMTVSEAMKMLKDFNVSTLQASQKDVMAMFRAINKDILKKKDAKKNLQNALMTAIDFEGFVEFLMQIAVHLYSFDSAMTPVEYLGKLFETFTKSSSNIGKLFLPGNAEEGQLHSGVVDNKLLAELNRRLSYDPSYQLPEGFSKVIEREIENKYSIPTYFPIKHSKRVVLEVLDGFLNELFGIHIIEPMAEVIEHARAHPILKHMVRDKVMSEVGLNANKQALQTKRTAVVRQGRADKPSNSTDANPISKQGKLGAPALQRDLSKAEIRGQLNLKNEALPPPKPTLGPTLKIEIAKQPAKQRENFLDAAYALEEILMAVEKGETVLERLHNKDDKKKPINRVLEDRQKKLENEAKKEQDDRKKLEERKKLLKEQLDKMKVEKKKKAREEKLKKTEEDKKEEAKQKKKQDKLNADLNKLKEEFALKREVKLKEAEDKKATEPAQVDPATKKQENKAILKQRKEGIMEDNRAKAEARTSQKQVEEERKIKKDQLEKQKAEQIKKMYQETKEKAREIKNRYKEEYDRFYSSPKIQAVYTSYEKALLTFMEIYSKLDGVAIKDGQVTLSYSAYMNMGKKLKLYPSIVSSQDYVFAYKTMMKVKMKAEKEGLVKYDTLQDVQGTKLNFSEFKEILLKIACLGKYKLPGGPEISEDEIRIAKNEERKKKKDALATAAQSGVLKKAKDEFEEGHVNEDLLNVFEKEFDVNDMNEKTIESLFKNVLNLKPDKAVGASSTLKPVRASGASPEKSIKAKPVLIGGGNSGDL